jgi:TRAP-type C4-dicarboxylate transport system permease small subunit
VARIAAAYGHVINSLRVLAGIVIFAVFALIVGDVFVRLAGFQPWLYANILVEYGLLWFTMLAAPWLVRAKAHVFIDALTLVLPAALRQTLAKCVYVICICASLVFSYYSLRLLMESIAENQIDIRAVDMPQWILLAPIPLCFFLVAIEFVRYLIGPDSMYGKRADSTDNV